MQVKKELLFSCLIPKPCIYMYLHVYGLRNVSRKPKRVTDSPTATFGSITWCCYALPRLRISHTLRLKNLCSKGQIKSRGGGG